MSVEKLDLQSPDMVNENFEKLAHLFPNCVTEGSEGKAIDFDLLKQELSHAVIEGNRERYRLEWPGKREAIVTANLPTTKTLRPVKEDSVDFNNTENIYIEGDNLEVLKILQESYFGKIKMIYIDPPYNTGNDFVYRDNFTGDKEAELFESGQIDEYNQRLVTNPDSSGRYHSDWLTMMYPRLKLARNLLTDDGVIFISIDDNEQVNLKKLCDEIFGENAFVALFPWRKRTAKSDVPYGVSQDYEWLICYAKSNEFQAGIEGGTRKYYETDDLPNRPWRIHDLTKQTSATERPNSYFTIINPKNGDEYPANPNRTWAVTKETFEKYYAESRIVFPGEYEFLNISRPAFRYFQADDISKAGEMFGFIPVSTRFPEEIGMSQDGTKDFNLLFGKKIFGFPKPNSLIKYITKTASPLESNFIILDFFSGSATTAHAVMQLNAEDGGKRKHIMVQIPEMIDEKSEAYSDGYKNICEIGKERIRRAAEQIRNEKWEATQKQAQADGVVVDYSDTQDYGFRVYRLDSSNMEDVYYRPQDYKQESMDVFADNIKAGRSSEDLLTQIMLDWGLPLSYRIEELEVQGKKTFKVAEGALIACFDKGISEDFAKEIATQKPLRIVFRDSGFANDTAKINVQQLLKQLSPETEMKVI